MGLLYGNQDTPGDFLTVLNVAGEKLGLSGNWGTEESVSMAKDFEYEVSCLQCLGFSIFLEPLRASKYVMELVRSKFGFLHNLYCERIKFLVGFKSEPVLSMFCTAEPLRSSAEIMGHLNRMTTYNCIDIEKNGELVARAILLLAFQSAKPLP